MSLNSLLQSPDNSQRSAALATVNKWERTGLLEGLRNETERAGMAQLLENQARQLVKEASQTGTANGSEEWAGVALPLVRRIFAEFAAKEFVSVQPMNLPSGLVFYLDFKYGTAQPGFDNDNSNRTGDPFGNPNALDSLFGVTTTGSDAAGGLYGAGRFGYSINNVTTSNLSAVASTGSGAGALTDAADVNYDGAYSASLSSYKKVTVAMPTNTDLFAVRAFTLLSGSTEVIPVQAFSKITSDYTASFIVTTADATKIQLAKAASALYVQYSVQPSDVTRGDFEDKDPFKGSGTSGINQGTDIDIPEINLEMQSDPIVAKTRKLKAVWTPEFAQDLNAYHSIDAEAELTSMLSEYVSMEIDLEILDMLISAAPTTEYWSALNNNVWNGAGFTQAAAGAVGAAGDGFYNTQGGWFQTLGTKLQKVSNKIHQKTLRGGANFLVTSPAVATILESIPGFAADTDGTKMEFAAGVQKIGAINNRYTVYKNPYMMENVILMGFRGSQFLETGAVYSPYIPLIMTPLVYDPVNFTPRKGVMTRYAKKVVRPEFYGKVYVHGLNVL
ncbi:Capsid protein, T4-like bacteriophage [uncultured Caudovirales phage]|uniref:Capsid protein, T4-like bacteriophage n=1 Tax=uncultured Caudovirales phage TaxID=2100421 RepID=A0A6J5NNL9_9CAUD|nr:Capsid protein, T4-like bacteriophage [uncultured Caudovirales phage]